jgi:hypothetical protein
MGTFFESTMSEWDCGWALWNRWEYRSDFRLIPRQGGLTWGIGTIQASGRFGEVGTGAPAVLIEIVLAARGTGARTHADGRRAAHSAVEPGPAGHQASEIAGVAVVGVHVTFGARNKRRYGRRLAWGIGRVE